MIWSNFLNQFIQITLIKKGKIICKCIFIDYNQNVNCSKIDYAMSEINNTTLIDISKDTNNKMGDMRTMAIVAVCTLGVSLLFAIIVSLINAIRKKRHYNIVEDNHKKIINTLKNQEVKTQERK